MKTIVSQFKIEIYESPSILSSIDIDSSEFNSFETEVFGAFLLHGYELESCHDHESDSGHSYYYVYTKVENDIKLKMIVELRLSDHPANDRMIKGKLVPNKKSAEAHLKKLAQELATKYGQTRGYRYRRIDIIFDDNHYTSYEEALREIENKLDSYEEYLT